MRRWIYCAHRRWRAARRLERMRARCRFCGDFHTKNGFGEFVCMERHCADMERQERVFWQLAEDSKPGPKSLFEVCR